MIYNKYHIIKLSSFFIKPIEKRKVLQTIFSTELSPVYTLKISKILELRFEEQVKYLT